MLPFGKIRDGVFELAAKVGISRVASVPRPPSGVHGKLFHVSQPSLLRDTGDAARRQHRELGIQVYRLRAL